MEPYAADRGTYWVAVRYLNEPEPQPTFTLFVNAQPQGRRWRAPGRGAGWQDQVIDNVVLSAEDEIAVAAPGGIARLDYVYLNLANAPEN